MAATRCRPSPPLPSTTQPLRWVRRHSLASLPPPLRLPSAPPFSWPLLLLLPVLLPLPEPLPVPLPVLLPLPVPLPVLLPPPMVQMQEMNSNSSWRERGENSGS